MKRKTFPPGQFSLSDCFHKITTASNDSGYDNARLIKSVGDGSMASMDHGLLRWIRNNCGLWEFGTDRVVQDIVDGHLSGERPSTFLTNNKFTHSRVPIDLLNTKDNSIIDYSLEHPDNCSVVILELLIRKLRNEVADSTN